MQVLSSLPTDFGGAIFIVQHIPAYAKSNLAVVLQQRTPLHVKQGEDGETITAGTIYVAPADRHLMVDEGKVVVSKGPKENRFRPAVDTLFRSAAHTYRERVVGVVLSGALNDGTSGMWMINRLGGTAIVQDPEEAMFSDMPEGVMQYTEVDHVLPAADIGKRIGELARKQIKKLNGHSHVGITDDKLLQIEVDIAKGQNGLNMGILEQGKPSPLACPECHGALTQFEEGKLIRFRCHTGHAHTADSLLASVRENVEKSMWEVMRGMEESHLLLDRMAEKMELTEQTDMADRYRKRARQIQRQAVKVQEAILGHDLSETLSSAALQHHF